ncbi:hypothetical protein J4H86_23830 [Spiractinospora alimapuensis]|uniref:hypothetical protein n=1 Tax=Spiractinospora alimapuensis TaxID=2820884 RepID=UPI001F492345|nr:hypothetical protein [Spiractinospora alimapuensis]QVQ51761.1 hypothetical protein J4H86_23830 [Spiractinospora alimapuensis]
MATTTDRTVDLATQRWVRVTGRRLDLREHSWLDGPVGAPDVVGDRWVRAEARRVGGRVTEGDSGGLLCSMGDLAGAGFDPEALRPEVRNFYEATARWRMRAWATWWPPAYPFGWMLSRVFSQRLQQLALPLRRSDTAQGMDSAVVPVRVGESLAGTAWVRRLRATGQMVYSGWYGIATRPGAQRPSVRVVFPLPNGNVTVFLRPENASGGALRLVSPRGRFGDDGAYLLVRAADQVGAWVRRVPIVETFDVYVDPHGTLRTDHDLRLWSLPALRLHYRMDRVQSTADDAM